MDPLMCPSPFRVMSTPRIKAGGISQRDLRNANGVKASNRSIPRVSPVIQILKVKVGSGSQCNLLRIASTDGL
jgi:hypothetical protein